LKKLIIWGIPAVALIGLVIWRFSQVAETKSQGGKQRGSGTVAEVQVAPATSRMIVSTMQAVADIESPQKFEVSPKSAGRIDYLTAREGDVVTAGEVLLKIDPSDLTGAMLQQQASLAESQARLAQAKLTQNANSVGIRSQIQLQHATLSSNQANLKLAQQNYAAEVEAAQAMVTNAESGVADMQAALGKEQANLKNLQVTYDRTLNLFKQNFIASQDVDNAKTAVAVEQGAVAVAQAQLNGAKATLKNQEDNLAIAKRKGLADIAAAQATVKEAEATLKAAQANKAQRPAYQENLNALGSEVSSQAAQLQQAKSRLTDLTIISPIAGTVTARKSDPGDQATPGSPVLEVQYLDWLYVNATLPVDFATSIQAGQTATITIDGLPGRVYRGPIININPAADPLSRQFGIKVRLDNQDHLVRPGMYGQITIVTSQVYAKVVVPRAAIATAADGSTTVTVVGSDNVAHVHKVTQGVSDAQGIQITSGVNPGDQVVVLSYATLRDGAKVKTTLAPTKPTTSTPPTPNAVPTNPPPASPPNGKPTVMPSPPEASTTTLPPVGKQPTPPTVTIRASKVRQ